MGTPCDRNRAFFKKSGYCYTMREIVMEFMDFHVTPTLLSEEEDELPGFGWDTKIEAKSNIKDRN